MQWHRFNKNLASQAYDVFCLLILPLRPYPLLASRADHCFDFVLGAGNVSLFVSGCVDVCDVMWCDVTSCAVGDAMMLPYPDPDPDPQMNDAISRTRVVKALKRPRKIRACYLMSMKLNSTQTHLEPPDFRRAQFINRIENPNRVWCIAAIYYCHPPL